jgi:cell pole-organizing protein PopZ
MAMNEPQAEPSMEEILASIRRIIAEDDQGGGASDEPLDLHEMAPVEEPVMAVAAPVAAHVSDSDDLVFEDAAFDEPEPMPAPAPAPRHEAAPPLMAAAPVQAAATVREEALLSDAVATVTAGALSRLAGSLRLADNPNQTIEGIVREMLQPMLKEWLDQNLPTIVDAKVEAALERVARLAR